MVENCFRILFSIFIALLTSMRYCRVTLDPGYWVSVSKVSNEFQLLRKEFCVFMPGIEVSVGVRRKSEKEGERVRKGEKGRGNGNKRGRRKESEGGDRMVTGRREGERRNGKRVKKKIREEGLDG